MGWIFLLILLKEAGVLAIIQEEFIKITGLNYHSIYFS